MGTFTSKELVHKVERIKQLMDAGFNTPRMYYIFAEESNSVLDNLYSWAKLIHEKEPNQIFNIRTYRTVDKLEQKNTPHITDVKFDDIIKELKGLRSKNYTCMVDAETPDNGRWAGNVVVFKETGLYEIEYCTKPVRAMVREADQNMTGNIRSYQGALATPLAMVVGRVVQAKFYDVILEWTMFNGPAGIKREPVVWWESRKY